MSFEHSIFGFWLNRDFRSAANHAKQEGQLARQGLWMGIYPPSLEHLIEQFSKLPGIGQKSAARMALHIVRNGKDLAEGLARSLLEVRERIRFCSICFNLTDEEPCPVCRDESRANGSLCIVEGPGDQLALENAGVFRGRYHVLHGVLSPLDGVGPEELRIDRLLARLDRENIQEIILATNPTTAGEATAGLLARILLERNNCLQITRIALGVPMGGDLKYMDPMTIQHALRSRMPLHP